MYFDLLKFAQRQGLLYYPFDKPFNAVKNETTPAPIGTNEEGKPVYQCRDCGNAISEDDIMFWDEEKGTQNYYQEVNLTPDEVYQFSTAMNDIVNTYLAEFNKENPNIESIKGVISTKIKTLPHIDKIDNLINMLGRHNWNSNYVYAKEYLKKFLETGDVDNLYQVSRISSRSIEQNLLDDIEAASKFETSLINKSPICDDCAEDYTKCDSCNEYIPTDENKYDVAGGDVICQECLDNGEYSSCDECGALDHMDNMHWVEARDASYCDNCYHNLKMDYDDFKDEIEDAARENPYPFKHWFPKESNRLYMDFVPDYTPDENDVQIMDFLSSAGCQVSQAEYLKGYCDFRGRTFKIGKFLERLKSERKQKIQSKNTIRNPEVLEKTLRRLDMQFGMMLKQFVDSPSRRSAKKSDLKIVISQDPHDIGQMSTGRNWTSCMELGTGAHYEDVFCEIKNGGLIAYLIQADDEDIEQPLARISIKRFANETGQSLALPERTVYGNAPQGFIRQVRNWLESRQKDLPKGTYKRKGGYWSDTYTGREYELAFNRLCSMIKTACGNRGWYGLMKDALTLMNFLKK